MHQSIKVDSSVFDSTDVVHSLAFGLAFLQRMDMKPVVVMGVSHHDALPVGESENSRLLVAQTQQLTEALQQQSATVLPFFSAEVFLGLQKAPHGSSAGPSLWVDTGLLQWSLNCGMIPLVCPARRDERGRAAILDSMEVTAAISHALQPHKVMFLTNTGGLRNQQNQVSDTVWLPGDLPHLSTAPWLSAKERHRVAGIARLLHRLPTESSAVITSADTLLTELFSHKGTGSLFKNREPINRYTSFDGIDVNRLLALINKTFDKTLKRDYLESLKGRLHSVYLSEGYFKHCEGSFANGEWIVFWWGLTDIRESYELVEYAKNLPDSFQPSPLPPTQILKASLNTPASE